MTILAQYGWGKSDYIETAAASRNIAGVVLSPRYESPAAIRAYARGLRATLSGFRILFDPQFYVTTIPAARDGELPRYPYYNRSQTRASFNPKTVQQFAAQTLDYQNGLPIDQFISPSVLFNSFRDPWSQIAISLAQASTDWHRSHKHKRDLLVSLVFDEAALRDRDALEEFLNVITAIDAKGFYVLVRRSDPNYQASTDPDALTNLLYLTYSLTQANEFEVVFGYTDLVGLVLQAAGASAQATGWFNSLRQFSFRPFEQTSGGRVPRPRYTSRPLLNSILLNPELAQAHRIGKIDTVLSGTSSDGTLRANPTSSAWDRKIASLHHWEILRLASAEISRAKTSSAALDVIQRMIDSALATYATLRTGGVVFDAATGDRELQVWKQAVAQLRLDLKI